MRSSMRSDLSGNWVGRIFAFWFGRAEMSERRRACLDTFGNSECRTHLVTAETLDSFAVPTKPFHPAFHFLSPIHQSDYLRAYFMHHFGGGYADIKAISHSWIPAFSAAEKGHVLGAGYAEVAGGVARIHQSKALEKHYFLDRRVSNLEINMRYRYLKLRRGVLIGNGAFIFRPGTEFTRRWLSIVERRLDLLLPHLEANPARYPKEVPGVDYGDGPSRYTVPWSFLLGDVLAPLTLQYHTRILQVVPAPDFENYE
ncbi:hypothetical protein [Nitratireductor aquibiodomus]|uniref:hypothetical protein n=1 Tax=Nitratireductor aquibiodomus TaxID=204799 RepID=UPI0009E001BB|nr:hypothetical protein [Nitratireductor aquibiodomus]